MSLFSHELVHLLITSLVAGYIYSKYRQHYSRHSGIRSWRISGININKTLVLIAACFLIGIFLDIDHLFDYFLWSGGKFSLVEFFKPSLYVHLSGKVYVPLHGFEIGITLWFVSKWAEKKLKFKGLALALTLSYFIHLLWDNFSFPHHPLAYFIIYRILNNFSVSSFDGV